MFRSFSLLILSLVIVSCRNSPPEIQGFDRDAWSRDSKACRGERLLMRPILEADSKKLLSLNEDEVVEVLGKPDENELYKRNQKFFYYYLTPARSCGGDSTGSSERFVVRFNAMGLAKEVYFDRK